MCTLAGLCFSRRKWDAEWGQGKTRCRGMKNEMQGGACRAILFVKLYSVYSRSVRATHECGQWIQLLVHSAGRNINWAGVFAEYLMSICLFSLSVHIPLFTEQFKRVIMCSHYTVPSLFWYSYHLHIQNYSEQIICLIPVKDCRICRERKVVTRVHTTVF